MIPIRDLGLHTKVQSLQALFMTLTSALHPTVVYGSDGVPEIVDCKIGPGVKTSIEMALVHTCNRIADFMGDNRNWVDGQQAEDILGALMQQAVDETGAGTKPPPKPRKPRRSKGTDSDDSKK